MIITNGTKCSLQQLIGFLGLYEEESGSGQLINKDKSCYIVIVLEVTGFKRRNLPVKYLAALYLLVENK